MSPGASGVARSASLKMMMTSPSRRDLPSVTNLQLPRLRAQARLSSPISTSTTTLVVVLTRQPTSRPVPTGNAHELAVSYGRLDSRCQRTFLLILAGWSAHILRTSGSNTRIIGQRFGWGCNFLVALRAALDFHFSFICIHDQWPCS